MVQFLRASLCGPETFLLEGLVRGQGGSGGHGSASLPPGAKVVALDSELVRLEMTPGERGLPLVWRAEAANYAGGLAATEAEFVWWDVASRPWSPAHLRGRRKSGGSLGLRWVRRARVGGDSWAGEPPLAEDSEVYRVEVWNDAGLIRAWTVGEQQALYTAEAIAADFPHGRPDRVIVEVRQHSASFGWGSPARKRLWL
jgi:hypothetical protein